MVVGKLVDRERSEFTDGLAKLNAGVRGEILSRLSGEEGGDR